MKRFWLTALVFAVILCIAACKPQTENVPKVQTTVPESTAAPTLSEETEPVATEDPFEFESEIDFSDFETEPEATEPVDTKPEATEPQAKPEPTIPEASEPTPTEPEATQPEETDPPETTVPSYEPDGYNSQIVRP